MNWWHYLLLVNFYLVLFFGFYALLLRRETFFQLNRVYLVAASLLSFLIPLIQSDWVKNLFITQEVQATIYSSPVIMQYNITATAQNSLTVGEVLNAVYIAVTLFLVLRLVWQLVILKKAIEKPEPSAAYSFFKKISLGNNLSNPGVIAEHEQVHARQWHSVDVLIIETVMIINWFNPVVYLYRFAIKYIHEFIADRQVLQKGTDKADYALLLLSQTFDVPAHGLVTPFYNHSLLKKRIMMLQKSRSQRIALAKYGLSAPLFALMLIFSSATVNNSKAVNAINKKAENVFSMPAEEAVTGITDHAEIPGEVKDDTAHRSTSQTMAVPPKYAILDTVPRINDKIYVAVEQQPQFPGGFDALTQFLKGNIKYPAIMREKNIQGHVYIEFVVEKDGSLSGIKAVRGPGYGAEEEALRVLSLSPKWIPGYQNGKPVRVVYTVPVNFRLDNGNANVIETMRVYANYKADTGRQIDIRGLAARDSDFKRVVFVIDGVPRRWDDFSRLDPKDIISFSVLKGPYSSVYSNKNGVIIVHTRKSVNPDDPKIIAASGEIFNSVENPPQFPGGMDALSNFLRRNIHYPATMREANIQGQVLVSFTVEMDGTLSNIKAVQGPGYGSEEEAERVMALSPKWVPGNKNGKWVRVKYTVPVNFALNNVPGNYASGNGTQIDIRGFSNGGGKVYSAVEHQPEFPGGMDKFNQFLIANVKYPEAMRQANVQGKAYLAFIVEPDGSLSNIRSVKDPGYGSGEEAIRVMGLSPKWKPGYQNGVAVRVEYVVPVNFSLENKSGAVFGPKFPGGLAKFNQFITENIRYPAAMREANVEGRAFVRFSIEPDGSVANIKILRDVGYGSGEEAERVIALSPKWIPGHKNDVSVRVVFVMPVDFTLRDENGTVYGAIADTGTRKLVGLRMKQYQFNNGPGGKEPVPGNRDFSKIQTVWVSNKKEAFSYNSLNGSRVAVSNDAVNVKLDGRPRQYTFSTLAVTAKKPQYPLSTNNSNIYKLYN